jgi:hypothetical protein
VTTFTEPFRFLTETEFQALSLNEQHRYLLKAHARLGAEATLLRSFAATLADEQNVTGSGPGEVENPAI